VDKNEISYGSQVLGETCKKTIMLINDGALATKFRVNKVPAEPVPDVITSLPESVKPHALCCLITVAQKSPFVI
jgi:hypothetical protein